MNAFFQAIHSFFDANASSDFYLAVGDEFYYAQAETQAHAYAVYFGMPFMPEDTWTNTVTEASFQVNCHAVIAREAGEMAEACMQLFDGARLSMAGYQEVVLERQMITPPWRVDDLWTASVEFKGILIKR